MRHGNPRRAGTRNRGCNAWDDLARDPGILERLELLTSSSEDERVASLETHDVMTPPSFRDEHAVHGALPPSPVGAQRLRGDPAGPAGDSGEDLGADESVEHDDVGTANRLDPP